eukprot:CAMPEP_0118923536 /NCGR_PEP_ID=MMETSP1169-20130426/2020_1 /TAXON_ID=36882 /ORGANISM="Pyramimonas obovata, Strain CCMP722" /LENGTH=625 /DNA_ID=CAMNT_0006864543 /DNA_START=30 /DNA_END=1907 /DNA_ORIENTATION=+
MQAIFLSAVGVGVAVKALQRKRKMENPSPVLTLKSVPAGFKTELFGNPYDLPRLPIPALEDTTKKYLAAVRPLTDDAEYAKQEKLVKAFTEGVGAELHKKLVEKDAAAAKSGSYPFSFIEECWDKMYYGERCPAPINFSPYFAVTGLKGSQTSNAAMFAHSFTKWTQRVLKGELAQDAGACSYGFPKHIGSAKVPKKGLDTLVMYSNESTNVIVICNEQIFSVEVLSKDGTILDVAGLEAKFDEIKKMAAAGTKGPKVQSLTSEDRDVWADARSTLEKDASNKALLKEIDQAIIVVCLDGAPKNPNDLVERSDRLLIAPTATRWWDKFMLVVDESGFMGVTCEHSYADGTNWGRFIRETMNDALGKPDPSGPLPTLPTHAAAAAPAPKPLVFTVSADMESKIAAAEANHAKLTGDLETAVIDFTEFGKGAIKGWNCSPDGAVQLAFQAAYYQLHGRMPPVYEACATRKFHHGRTETIRSTTSDSKAFVEALAKNAPKAETLALMQAAAKTHGGNAKGCSNGAGIDRHFTAMAAIATKEGTKVDLFEDATFKYSKSWHLSTSNGTQPYLSMFGFGAVIPQGYGLGYLVNNDDISIVCTSYKSCAETSSAKMASSIEETLKKMKALV